MVNGLALILHLFKLIQFLHSTLHFVSYLRFYSFTQQHLDYIGTLYSLLSSLSTFFSEKLNFKLQWTDQINRKTRPQ